MKQFSCCLTRTAVFILVELGGAKQVESMTVAGLNVNQVLGCLQIVMCRVSLIVSSGKHKLKTVKTSF